MKVELIDRSNGDLLAVNSARVSMAKHHDTFEPETDRRLLAYLARENHFTPYTHARMTACVTTFDFDPLAFSAEDRAGLEWVKTGEWGVKMRHSVWGWARLLRTSKVWGNSAQAIGALLSERFPEQAKMLDVNWKAPDCLIARHRHDESTETDPRFIDVTFRLTACIPVVRQIQKTMVGLALNEVSRRYVDEPPTFDTPKVWRSRPAWDIKQGSGQALGGFTQARARVVFAIARGVSRVAYELLLRYGVAPEQARWALLQAMETQGYFTYSLATLKRLYYLRVDGHAQSEAGDVVREMSLAVTCSGETNVMAAWAGL